MVMSTIALIQDRQASVRVDLLMSKLSEREIEYLHESIHKGNEHGQANKQFGGKNDGEIWNTQSSLD
jgi:hypothetical protein